MDREIARLTPANAPANLPPIKREILARRTRQDVVEEIKRGQRVGDYGAASTVVRVPTGPMAGYFAARVQVLRVPAPPAPAWHRTAKILATITGSLGLLCVGAAYALRELGKAVAAATAGVPWPTVLGGIVLSVLVLGIGTRAGRRVCVTIVRHHH